MYEQNVDMTVNATALTNVNQVDALAFQEEDLSNLNQKDSSKTNFDKSRCASALSYSKGQLRGQSEDKIGFCLILSFQTFDEDLASEEYISDRDGNEKDLEDLYACFLALGCDVKVFSNLKSKEIPEILNSELQNHSNSKYFICCILTHGEEGILYTYDAPLDIDQFLHPFSSHSNSLDGKPKIFFIQACRGNAYECSTKVIFSGSRESYDGSNNRGFLKYPNFFIVNSTYPGKVSFRNPLNGSYFIQYLCDCLKQFGTSKDLLWIATYVTKQVAVSYEYNAMKFDSVKQMPHTISTLSTTVYFANQVDDYSHSHMLSCLPNENEEFDKETADITDVGRRVSRLKTRPAQSCCLPNVSVDVDSLEYCITKAEKVKLITFYKQHEAAAEVDYRKFSRTVCSVFQKLGASLHAENPYKKIKEITKYFQKFSEDDQPNIDCLICFVVVPKEKDYQKLDMFEILTGDKCRFLVGKPKIFIVLTCKSSKDQISTPQESTDGSSPCTIPLHADCLEVLIAVHDVTEMEDYIQIFCKVLEQYKSLHIHHILTNICFEFQERSNRKDISKLIWTSTLTRFLCFPKIDV